MPKKADLKALFQRTLTHVQTLFPLGAANDPKTIAVTDKYSKQFLTPYLSFKAECLTSLNLKDKIKYVQSILTSAQPFPAIFTKAEAERLETSIAMSLLYLFFEEKLTELKSLFIKEVITETVELHKLFGVANCGVQSFAGMMYLLENADDSYPICFFQANKKVEVEFKGLADPEQGHQTILIGNVNKLDECVVFDLWQGKAFNFTSWNKKALPGLRGKNLDWEASGTLYHSVTKQTKLPEPKIRHYNDATRDEIKKLIKQIAKFCTSKLLTDETQNIEEKEVKQIPNDAQALEILHSIDRLGITKAQPCSLRGVDKLDIFFKDFGLNKVFYNQIDLEAVPTQKVEETLTSAVFHQKEGMWAIAMEREYSKYKHEVELTEAAMSSIVFVFELDEIAKKGNGIPYTKLTSYNLGLPKHFNSPNQFQLMLENHENHKNQPIHFQEIRRSITTSFNGIPRNTFKAILVPYHLVDLVSSVYRDVRIIPVNAVCIKILVNPIELDIFGHMDAAVGKAVAGPNYERGLAIFRKEFPHIKKIGVHTTRLPLKSLPEFTPKLLDEKQYNKNYFKRFSLKSLDTEKLNILKLYPNDIYIFHEQKNDYVIVCRPKIENLVTRVVNDIKSFNQAASTLQKHYHGHQNRRAVSFFKERYQTLSTHKQQAIKLINENEFKEGSRVAMLADQFDRETKDLKKQFQDTSAVKFNQATRKMKI